MRTPRADRNGNGHRLRPSEEHQAARWVLEYVRRRACPAESTQARRAGDLPISYLKERIVRHYSPLVESIARRFLSSGEPLEDLIQEGQVGLLTALESFDPGKGVKFSTYATHFVAGTIRHFLRDKGRIIKEPSWLRDLARRVDQAAGLLTGRLGRTPHAAEVAALLELPETTIEEVLATRLVFQVMALNDTGEPGLAGVIDSDRIPASQTPGVAAHVEDRVLLEEAMERLKVVEQQVLREFFYHERSQAEIARQLGISGNYVSFLLRQSTQKLRRVLIEADLRERTRWTELSVIDPATGLHTAAYLYARLEEYLSHAVRATHSVAVLGLHISGLPDGPRRNEALGACGETVRQAVRRMDIVGRSASDDALLVVLPETGDQVAVVEARLWQVVPRAHPTLGFEILTAWHPENGRSARALLAQIGLWAVALPEAA